MSLEGGWRELIQHKERAPWTPSAPSCDTLARVLVVVSVVPSEQWQEKLFQEEDLVLKGVWELLLRLAAP